MKLLLKIGIIILLGIIAYLSLYFYSLTKIQLSNIDVQGLSELLRLRLVYFHAAELPPVHKVVPNLYVNVPRFEIQMPLVIETLATVMINDTQFPANDSKIDLYRLLNHRFPKELMLHHTLVWQKAS